MEAQLIIHTATKSLVYPPAENIFCLQRKTLEPFGKRISGWNEVWTLASLDILLQFLPAGTSPPNLWAYWRKVRAFWSLPLPSSDRRSRPSVDSACKEMSDGLLDLITVKTLYISGLVAVWPLRWYLFNEPTHVIFAYPSCVPVCRH